MENGVWKSYKDAGLMVVGVDPDKEDKALLSEVGAFCQNLGLTFPVGTEDDSTKTYNALKEVYDGANPYPVDVLVDKQGIIRYVAREYDPAHIESLVQELLAE